MRIRALRHSADEEVAPLQVKPKVAAKAAAKAEATKIWDKFRGAAESDASSEEM